MSFTLKNRVDNAKYIDGGIRWDVLNGGDTSATFMLLPYTGFIVEDGIQGAFVLECREIKNFNIIVKYDFPATGKDTFTANSTEATIARCDVADNGKYGGKNPHNLILTIARDPQLAEGQWSAEDATANFFRDTVTDLTKEVIKAFLTVGIGV